MCGRFSLFKISEFLQKYGFEADLKPRYNIAPTQEVPVISNGKLEFLRWGLPLKSNVINTRVETWNEKPFFSKMQRVLVPADGFYEWKSGQPYRVESSEVFAIAGISWKGGFSIITMPAINILRQVHGRMPAILQDEDEWVEKSEIRVRKDYSIARVSKLINNPKNNTAQVLVA
jgi:putative SOS response-associated peptidase YedK